MADWQTYGTFGTLHRCARAWWWIAYRSWKRSTDLHVFLAHVRHIHLFLFYFLDLQTNRETDNLEVCDGRNQTYRWPIWKCERRSRTCKSRRATASIMLFDWVLTNQPPLKCQIKLIKRELKHSHSVFPDGLDQHSLKHIVYLVGKLEWLCPPSPSLILLIYEMQNTMDIVFWGRWQSSTHACVSAKSIWKIYASN